MFLRQAFENADATPPVVLQGFADTWKELVDYMEQGAGGAIQPPYKVITDIKVDRRLDVHFQARLCSIPGPETTQERTISTRNFYNINLAGSLPFGDAYRHYKGRSASLSEVNGEPMPLYVMLTPRKMETAKQILRDWALWEIKSHETPGRRMLWVP